MLRSAAVGVVVFTPPLFESAGACNSLHGGFLKNIRAMQSKYTALYRVFDIRESRKMSKVEKIEGNNKEKLKKEIAAKVTPEQSYVWAVFDNKGECVYGGIMSARITETIIWDKRYVKGIAQRFFPRYTAMIEVGHDANK